MLIKKIEGGERLCTPHAVCGQLLCVSELDIQ